MMVEDRTYWHLPGTDAWHALRPTRALWLVALCHSRRTTKGREAEAETADRVPPDGHLCGSCGRVIAARTDVENEG